MRHPFFIYKTMITEEIHDFIKVQQEAKQKKGIDPFHISRAEIINHFIKSYSFPEIKEAMRELYKVNLLTAKSTIHGYAYTVVKGS